MEKKLLLKSRFHGDYWNSMEVVSLQVSALWASVPIAPKVKGRDFYGPIMKDIQENGLHFPLIVVDATRAQVLQQKKKYKNKLCDLPFDPKEGDLTKRQYVVWGGSNRWNIANELGYEYVDCVIVPNGEFDKARSMQKLHRKPYQGKYY